MTDCAELRSKLLRAERERDEAKKRSVQNGKALARMRTRAEAAEAEVAGERRSNERQAAEITALRAKLAEAEYFIGARGYRRCDIPACNCGSWHGGHAMDRLNEIGEVVGDHNGVTLLDAVRSIVKRAETAERERDEARLSTTMLSDTPHDIAECPTYYDGCHCTAANLHYCIDRAEAAEAEVARLRGALREVRLHPHADTCTMLLINSDDEDDCSCHWRATAALAPAEPDDHPDPAGATEVYCGTDPAPECGTIVCPDGCLCRVCVPNPKCAKCRDSGRVIPAISHASISPRPCPDCGGAS